MFVQCTKRDGSIIWINTNEIISMERVDEEKIYSFSWQGPFTEILLKNGSFLELKETPDDILNKRRL